MKISQREARKLRAENKKLKMILHDQKRGWGKEWPEAVACVLTWKADEQSKAVIGTVHRLNHAVVVTMKDDTVYFHAVEIPKP